jgi:hypothetical protein
VIGVALRASCWRSMWWFPGWRRDVREYILTFGFHVKMTKSADRARARGRLHPPIPTRLDPSKSFPPWKKTTDCEWILSQELVPKLESFDTKRHIFSRGLGVVTRSRESDVDTNTCVRSWCCLIVTCPDAQLLILDRCVKRLVRQSKLPKVFHNQSFNRLVDFPINQSIDYTYYLTPTPTLQSTMPVQPIRETCSGRRNSNFYLSDFMLNSLQST